MSNASAVPSDRSAVTVLGLGSMGAALATAFVRDDRRTTVWNRTPEKADRLVADGAVRAMTVADAVVASPLVVVCVLDHAAVLDILDALGDAATGRAVVNLTSGTPDQARAAAGWATARGVEYLDGGIMADPENIGTAEAMFVYSGSQGAFDVHEATLRLLGESVTYLGTDPGAASLHFMAIVGLCYETWISYLDTLALVGTDGVEASTFAPFATGMFTAMTGLMTAMARAVDDGHYPPDSGTLVVHQALMDDLIDTWESRNVDATRLRHVKALVDRRVAEGHGANGFSSLIEIIRTGPTASTSARTP